MVPFISCLPTQALCLFLEKNRRVRLGYEEDEEDCLDEDPYGEHVIRPSPVCVLVDETGQEWTKLWWTNELRWILIGRRQKLTTGPKNGVIV